MHEKNSPILGRLPSWNALRVFEAAARHASFVKAAGELCVTHGAVSRQIKTLEISMDVKLFDRRNRAVFLTPQGEILFSACKEMTANLLNGIRAMKAPASQRPLVVSCEPTIAIRWLVPRLPEFKQKHPQMLIHLLTAGGNVDFSRDGVDVALRRNDFEWGHQLHVELVAPEMVGPVFGATMPIEISSQMHALDLTEQQLLHSKTRPDAWSIWGKLTARNMRFAKGETFEHFYLSLQAAAAGLGVAIGSIYMVEDDIRDKRLIAPFGFIPDRSAYVLISPEPFAHDERRLVFLDWIRYAMGKTRLAAQLDSDVE